MLRGWAMTFWMAILMWSSRTLQSVETRIVESGHYEADFSKSKPNIAPSRDACNNKSILLLKVRKQEKLHFRVRGCWFDFRVVTCILQRYDYYDGKALQDPFKEHGIHRDWQWHYEFHFIIVHSVLWRSRLVHHWLRWCIWSDNKFILNF